MTERLGFPPPPNRPPAPPVAWNYPTAVRPVAPQNHASAGAIFGGLGATVLCAIFAFIQFGMGLGAVAYVGPQTAVQEAFSLIVALLWIETVVALLMVFVALAITIASSSNPATIRWVWLPLGINFTSAVAIIVFGFLSNAG